MTARARPIEPDLDPIATAGGLSALAGIASVAWPFFDGMTAALAALALLGWLIGRGGGARGLRDVRSLAPLVASVLGWGLFLGAEGPVGAVRGMALGISAGLVGWIGRRSARLGELP